MGEGRRPETVAVAEESPPPHPEITLRQISAWSLATLAAIAVGFVLYAAREVMLPVVAAFVVGVMLGPAARRLRSAARSARARRVIAGGEPDADHRSRDPVDLPARVRAHERLAGHASRRSRKSCTYSMACYAAWRRLTSMIGEPPSSDASRDSFARDFLGPFDDLGSVAADHGISVLSCRAAFVHLRMAGPAARSRHDVRKPRFAADGSQDPQ